MADSECKLFGDLGIPFVNVDALFENKDKLISCAKDIVRISNAFEARRKLFKIVDMRGEKITLFNEDVPKCCTILGPAWDKAYKRCCFHSQSRMILVNFDKLLENGKIWVGSMREVDEH